MSAASSGAGSGSGSTMPNASSFRCKFEKLARTPRGQEGSGLATATATVTELGSGAGLGQGNQSVSGAYRRWKFAQRLMHLKEADDVDVDRAQEAAKPLGPIGGLLDLVEELGSKRMYLPQPIETAHVHLSSELHELAELLAENSHEHWSLARKRQGWRYGPSRDLSQKLHPALLPFEFLAEQDKAYDREMATDTIKVMLMLGFRIEKANDPAFVPRSSDS